VEVRRNDDISIQELHQFDKFLLSPGPGLPRDAGIMNELIAEFHDSRPILGVCLGLQAIAEFYGASLTNLPHVLHGAQSHCQLSENPGLLFQDIPNNFKIGHYHSWVVDPKSISSELAVTARNENGHVMAFEHKENAVCGVQFHPESLLTEHGLKMIENWVKS